MTSTSYIKKWCESKETFYFFLPDGQVGRPFDDQYQVFDVSVGANGVSIRLSNDISLAFFGEIFFREEVCNLIIHGFDRLIYKVNGMVVREYSDGELCLSGF